MSLVCDCVSLATKHIASINICIFSFRRIFATLMQMNASVYNFLADFSASFHFGMKKRKLLPARVFPLYRSFPPFFFTFMRGNKFLRPASLSCSRQITISICVFMITFQLTLETLRSFLCLFLVFFSLP